MHRVLLCCLLGAVLLLTAPTVDAQTQPAAPSKAKASEEAAKESPSAPKEQVASKAAPPTPDLKPNELRAPALPPDVYTESFRLLFALFVMAILLESGLAAIFNWKPFIDLFDGRGVKTIVAVAFSFFFVRLFDLDAVARLAGIYSGHPYPNSFPGELVTALIVAGGSSGVNKVLIAVGFRSVKTAEAITPKPKPTEGWIAVRRVFDQSAGVLWVSIAPPGKMAIVGTLEKPSVSSRVSRYFIRDHGRFPNSGGYPVVPGQPYEVSLLDKAGVARATWGPITLGPGAIVDVDL